MKKSIRTIITGAFFMLMLLFILHIAASVLFDGPVDLSFALEKTPDNIALFLNEKMALLQADFEYIGCSTGDINASDGNILFSWYTSRLPAYLSLGTDAYVLCLAHFDSRQNEFDYAHVYIGSPKAIDSMVRRYAYSFQGAE
ncbi:MAG: hypothetical protein IKK75_12470 [Clostridia bacterium]|nr:hypothetical protein [Clostridia bacterium]